MTTPISSLANRLPLVCFATLLLALGLERSLAAGPRALPEGKLPEDTRLEPPKDLDGYFPFTPSDSPAAWEKRAAAVRQQLLVALGLWPMPAKTPLNPVIHGKFDAGDYTVEKVFFESVPGFYVTGSLYRPKDGKAKHPGVLSPHGHWDNGRFYDLGLAKTRQEIAQGAERFEDGGRSPLQSRCVQLARMGCVVFHYDMVGYADSIQISEDLAHHFNKQRPEMNSEQNWGLFSPEAEAHLQSVMSLQAIDSVRALDFLMDLPDVDGARVAVTGASGGGTQTFILGAIDPRPAVIFPAVMVSTAMQGGCTCENACLLRVDTGNVEFAAMFAPKPLGMTAANDWTKEMETKGFPELQAHFKMMGAPNNVALTPLLQFGHNYNYVSRAAMYSWMNKHLQLGLSEPIIERDYHRLNARELSVWDESHPKPTGGPDFERALLRWLTEDADKQLAPARKSAKSYRETVGPAADVLIGRNFATAGDVTWQLGPKTDRGSFLEMTGTLRNKTYGEELPVTFLYPKQWGGQTVIWVDSEGKSCLYAADGSVKADIKTLLDAGATVVGMDLLFQGEFVANGEPVTRARSVKNPRESAAFTLGYNRALFAQRVHDVLTLLKYVKNHEQHSEIVDVVGLGGAGPWVAAAKAQAGDAIDRAVIDTAGFRFGKVRDYLDPAFLPGGAKYDDLPGLLALGAPGKLWLAGEGEHAPDLLRTIYASAKAEANLTTYAGSTDATRDAAIKWLLAKP